MRKTIVLLAGAVYLLNACSKKETATMCVPCKDERVMFDEPTSDLHPNLKVENNLEFDICDVKVYSDNSRANNGLYTIVPYGNIKSKQTTPFIPHERLFPNNKTTFILNGDKVEISSFCMMPEDSLLPGHMYVYTIDWLDKATKKCTFTVKEVH